MRKLPVFCLAAAMLFCGCSDSVSDDTDSSAAETELPMTAPDHYIGVDPPMLFDVHPIAEAYKSGDSSELSPVEAEILAKASEILGKIITPDMSDYDKELAVHDYMVLNCAYDTATLSVIPVYSEHCRDPYGVLIDGKAICEGYTTAFGMFMEMLDIPCETVYSIDITDDHDHSWNIVTINGAPYYVDVTWDDIVPDRGDDLILHTYFNVTADHMRLEHLLPNSCPETKVLTDCYAQRELFAQPVSVDDVTPLIPAIEAAAAKHADSVSFIPDDPDKWDSLLYPIDETYFKLDKKLYDELFGICTAAGCRFLGIIHYAYTDSGRVLVMQFRYGDR